MSTNSIRSTNYLLCLVTDSELCLPRSIEEIVKDAIEGGVNMVQFREKNASTCALLEKGQHLKEILKPYKVPLIINDRIDIALALDAEGVHLGQSDMPYKIARKLLGPDKIIGLSINTLEQAIQAENTDVSYLSVSPLFHTNTKNDISMPWGLNKLKELRKISKHKLFGIGGINEQNVGEVLEAGIDGIAVVSALCSSSYPKQSAINLIKKMQSVKIKQP